jgi:ABC-type phosphate transport system auxiliary subunit
MPKTKQTSKTFAKRFAALLAGFDTGNPCDEEALGKGLAMRRMAVGMKMRIVDLLETEDIRQAIDDQLQPVRQDSRKLQKAMEHDAAVTEELIERTRDVGKLADLLRRERKTNETLRNELAALTRAYRDAQTRNRQTGGTVAPARASNNFAHSFGAQSFVFEFVIVGAALVLLSMAVIHLVGNF